MRHRYRALRCECDTVPSGQPSGRDRYQEGEIRVPHPTCDVQKDEDGEHIDPVDYDTDYCMEHYGVAYSYARGEWVECEGIDEETGEPIANSERWVPLPGYVGSYEVSDMGNVRSLDRSYIDTTGRHYFLKGAPLVARDEPKTGYRIVKLSKSGKQKTLRIHRLVMLAFSGQPPEGQEVCHNDGDPTNNELTNLRYGTRSANMYDRRLHGTDHEVNKTHCPRGHEYIPANIPAWAAKQGKRRCLACERARGKRRANPDIPFKGLADQYYSDIIKEQDAA